MVIFSKQQAFLLDDCNEMMVRMHHRIFFGGPCLRCVAAWHQPNMHLHLL